MFTMKTHQQTALEEKEYSIHRGGNDRKDHWNQLLLGTRKDGNTYNKGKGKKSIKG